MDKSVQKEDHYTIIN